MNALQVAESGLERCWSIFHDKGERNPGDVLSLQTQLLKVLSDAEQVYREISRERDRLIASRPQLKPDWFKRRLAQLDHYKKSIRIILGIGRALGDGFAWMFYRNDDQLVDEHLKHQRQILLPPGIGGRGERLFLQNFQNANGTLAIYHGLTTFLRMGDFSFYDPATQRISAIGELKTAEIESGGHELQMNIIAQFNSPLMDLAKTAPRHAPKTRKTLSEQQQTRLKRQVADIIRAIKASESRKSDDHVTSTKKIDMSRLQALFDMPSGGGPRVAQVDPGLILVAVELTGTIAKREFGKQKTDFMDQLKGVENEVRKVSMPGNSDNALIIGMVGFTEDHQSYMLPGTPPIFWWPLTEKQKHDLIFGRLVVLSCYNPAHFLTMLRNRGYQVSADNMGKITGATKTLPDGRTLQLENFSYFQQMSAGYLLTLDIIENLIEVMEAKASEQAKGGPIRIQMRPKLIFDR